MMEHYTVVCDESYITDERLRGIAAFSMPSSKYSPVKDEISKILLSSNIKEFKWQQLKDAKYRFCALKLIDLIINKIIEYKLRIDIITWDTHDSRHRIKYRDDNANFERMYFHLLKSSMKRRPKSSFWRIFPDEKTGVDWSTINDCLSSVGRWIEDDEITLFRTFIAENNFEIEVLKQIHSHEHPACQVADLFAGLSVFSVKHFKKFKAWDTEQSQQISMFNNDKISFSKSEHERCRVLKYLIEKTKSYSLGVIARSR